MVQKYELKLKSKASRNTWENKENLQPNKIIFQEKWKIQTLQTFWILIGSRETILKRLSVTWKSFELDKKSAILNVSKFEIFASLNN